MNSGAKRVQSVYLSLTLLNTLAASFIFGINTLFLLDAGLSNAQAFLVNAFFTVGQVIFEIPTGIVADVKGRRTSYLLGTVTLAAATLVYLGAWQMSAGLVVWSLASIMLGLGFTFFSGATEAWLVDALEFVGFKGALESVFAKGQAVGGVAMLSGSVAGGFIAQATSLGVPYVLRALVLGVTFVVAFVFMKDLGFKPAKSGKLSKDVKRVLTTSVRLGWRNDSIKWVMLARVFTGGVGIYAFYAMQPYLLELYGDKSAYGVVGLAAALVAGAQIVGSLAVPLVRRWFSKRTTVILTGLVINVVVLVMIGVAGNFWLAIVLMATWGLVFAAVGPVRQAYLNGLIPAHERATVLSFDSLVGSSGGVVIQPVLGRAADVWSYSTSFVIGGVIQAVAVPLVWLAQKSKPKSDLID